MPVICHLSLYLRYEPSGVRAEFARSRIDRYRNPSPAPGSGKLTLCRIR